MSGRSSIPLTNTLHSSVDSYIFDNLLKIRKSDEEIVRLSGYSGGEAGSKIPQIKQWQDSVVLSIAPVGRIALTFGQNVTDQEDVKQRLEIGKELFEQLTDDFPIVFFILNRQRKMVWWNKQVEVITGYSKKELTHVPVRKLFPPSEKKKIEHSVEKAFSEGSTEFESWLMTKNARRIPFLIKVYQTNIQGKSHVIGLGLNIVSTEKAGKESEQYRMLLQTITKQSDTVIFVKNAEGKYFMVNPKFEKVMDLRSRHIIGKTDFDLFDDTYAQVLREDDLEVIEQKKPRKFEEQIDTPQGKRYYLTSKFPLLGVPGLEQGICGIATDITRFKEKEGRARAQQKAITYLATNMALSEATLDTKLNTIARKSANTLKVNRVNIWLLENDFLRCISSYDAGHINMMKDKVMNMSTYPKFFKEIKSSREISIRDAQNDRRSRELTPDYLAPNDICSLLHTSVHMSKSVTLLVCHESVGEKRKWQQDEVAFAGAVADQVAQVLAKEEREIKEQAIRDSLKEKEILLSEIHHRVKNNLAVVSSMMQLQAFEEANEEVRSKLLGSVTRIKAMATIHEQLYQSQSFANIEFSENIRKLVIDVINIHQPPTQIELDFRLQPLQLNMNQAIPCSLIVNEAVTNILKHAFTGREEGRIIFGLSQDNDRIELVIKDNGVGLPENFDPATEKSLGVVLIDVLARQLEADYKFISDEGCEFRLWFEKSEGKRNSERSDRAK